MTTHGGRRKPGAGRFIRNNYGSITIYQERPDLFLVRAPSALDSENGRLLAVTQTREAAFAALARLSARGAG